MNIGEEIEEIQFDTPFEIPAPEEPVIPAVPVVPATPDRELEPV